MVDNFNPTSQFHPYQPMDDTPQSERSESAKEFFGKLRSYARENPGKVLGGLAAVAIGLSLLLKRSK
jgi:hypothetical protein